MDLWRNNLHLFHFFRFICPFPMQIYIFNAFKKFQTAAHQWNSMSYYCGKGSGKQIAHLLIRN